MDKNGIWVTQEQISEAASLINLAVENHQTWTVPHSGIGLLFVIFETLNIEVKE